MELQHAYILPFNTEEEKKHILEVIRKYNDLDPGAGEEFSHIFNVRLLKKKPMYIAQYTYAIVCGISGNGEGRSYTFDWFVDHKVWVIDFNSSMLKFISGKRTWEVIDTDGKVYKQSNKKGGKSELIDDYKWGKTEQKDTTPTKKEEEIDVGWIIRNQRLYKEGNLSQEVKNALEENENWSWDSIPTVYVQKELIKKSEENLCLRKELLKALYELEDLRKKGICTITPA
jgi:hypothetical protein